MKQHVSGKAGSACYGRMRAATCPGESSGLPTVLSMEASDRYVYHERSTLLLSLYCSNPSIPTARFKTS